MRGFVLSGESELSGEHGGQPPDRKVLAIGSIPLDKGSNVTLKLASRRVDISDSILMDTDFRGLASTNGVLIWGKEGLAKLDILVPQKGDIAVHGGATNFAWLPLRGLLPLYSSDRKVLIGRSQTDQRMVAYDTETMKPIQGDAAQVLSQTPIAQFYGGAYLAISDDMRDMTAQGFYTDHVELWQLTDSGWKTTRVKLPGGATVWGCQNVGGECELLVGGMDVGRPDIAVDIDRPESGKMQDLDVGLCDQTGKIIGHTNTMDSASDLCVDASYDRLVNYMWQSVQSGYPKTMTVRVWHPKTGVEEVLTVDASKAFYQMAKPIPSNHQE